MSRIAIYARISNDPEGLALGVTRQIEDCHVRAQALPGQEVIEYVDNDRSASTRSKRPRPQYQEMLDEIRAGDIQTVIAYSNSRLTRRPMEFEELIHLHELTGVRYLTIVSGDDNLATADGRMVARIKAAVDAAEAERTAERVARAALQRAQQGRNHGGVRAYGWRADDRRQLDPQEHKIKADVAERLLAGESLASVTRDLTERGIPSASWHPPLALKPWTTATIRGMLTNWRQCGFRVHNGEILGKGDWKPAFDEATVRELRDLLLDPARRTSPGRTPRYLLSGMGICGECGHTLTIKVALSSKTRRRTRYWCKQCALWRATAPVDEYVSGFIVGLLTDFSDQPTPGVPPAAVQAIEKLRERIESTRIAFTEDDTMTPTDLIKILRPLNERLRSEEAALRPARRPKVLKDATGASAAETWEALPLSRQRAIVSELVEVRLMRATGSVKTFDPASVVITRR